MTKLILLLTLPFFCQGSDTNCNDLREGIFKLQSGDGSSHTIVRTKTKQTENVGKTGLVSEFDIKWTSNCTYLLFNRRVIKGEDHKPSDFKLDTLHNEIIEVNGNRHKIVSSIRQNDFKVEATLIKVDTKNNSGIQQFSTDRKDFWDILPEPIGWVNDYEGLYTDDEELVLDSIVSVFKIETEFELAIVTIDTIAVTKDKFDELTLRIANRWGVGKKDKDNGILIGISRGHRKIRINNGFGIEKFITDSETKKIIDEYFIPYFKTGQYYNGTMTGLTELIKLLKSKLE